jgi:hypothetical protein
LRRLGELLNPFRLPARDDRLGAVAECCLAGPPAGAALDLKRCPQFPFFPQRHARPFCGSASGAWRVARFRNALRIGALLMQAGRVGRWFRGQTT